MHAQNVGCRAKQPGLPAAFGQGSTCKQDRQPCLHVGRLDGMAAAPADVVEGEQQHDARQRSGEADDHVEQEHDCG